MGKYTNKDHIYKRRLLKLADFLDKLPREKFNYETWVGQNWQGKQNLSCGTTACALGWATAIPSLRKAGLCMVRNMNPYSSTPGYVSVVGSDASEYSGPHKASRIVFGLTDQEHEYLFIPESSLINYEGDVLDEDQVSYTHGLKATGPREQATPKQVAKHIRRFVKAKYGSL